MKPVIIGTHTLEIPIIQGGMGVGISRAGLAGAVAKEGAMGVISAAQIGFDCEGFRQAPEAKNLEELPRQIARAKAYAEGKGIVAVNIMTATQDYENYVKTACKAGCDAIISGAGLPTNLPKYAAGFDVALAPIVSSAKSAKVILKYWHTKHDYCADFVVIEGPKAGGHLGFKKEDLADVDAIAFDEEIQAILDVVHGYEAMYNKTIPVFVAGGIMTADDVRHVLSLGASGVQVASRFVTTYECDAAQAYKDAYLAATDTNAVIVKSPVGMPGRALNNPFVKRAAEGPIPVKGCYNCLSACNPAQTPYCISQALINAVKGDVDNGLIFCGARVGELNKMEPVAAVIRDLNV